MAGNLLRSPAVRKHLDILADLLRRAGKRQSDVAQELGYKSASQVGMMLRGERPVSRQDLEGMCRMAGITIASLAAQSDDLTLTEHPESIRAASIMERLPEHQRKAALAMLEAMAGNPSIDTINHK